MSKNLIVRIIVAAIFIPLILWISYEGGWWLYGLVMFLAAMAMSEFLVAEGYSLKRPAFWLVLVAVITIVDAGTGQVLDLVINFLLAGKSGINWHLVDPRLRFWQYILIVPFLLISGMAFSVGKESPQELFSRLTRVTWGVLYIGLLYQFVYLLGLIETTMAIPSLHYGMIVRGKGIMGLQIDGGDALLFLFAILWIGDTAAMYVGKTFGKHKLAPSVSPNKTVEGFIGGLVAALIVGIVMSYWKFTEFPMYQILIVAVLCSLFGQLGDLVESMWKRSLDLKDSSAIIPGHGGFLDRFDSLLFAAPVMYYFFVIFR